MTFTHEQILDAVRKAGRDGKTFSCAAVREHLNLSTRDRRVLSRFHRQFRAFQEVAVDEIVKVGNNSYRLKSAVVAAPESVVAVASLEPESALEATEAAQAEEKAAPMDEAPTAPAFEIIAAEVAVVESVECATQDEELVAAESAVAESVEAEFVVTAEPAIEAPVSPELVAEVAEALVAETVAAAERPVEAAVAEVLVVAERAAQVAESSSDEVASSSFELEPQATAENADESALQTTSDVPSDAAAEPAFAARADASVADAPSVAAVEPAPAFAAQADASVADVPSVAAVERAPAFAAQADAPASFFDEPAAHFEPSADAAADLELPEIAASVPVEAQLDARRAMLSLSEAAQLFEAPAPREPAGSRVRSWVSLPLEHAQNLLSGAAWRERGQWLGRRVAGLFHRA